MNVCYRHPDRTAYVQCQRCSRPVCPQCQVPAPVGVQCPECVEQARRRRPVRRTQFGARAGSGRPLVTFSVMGLCAVMYVLQLLSGSWLAQWMPARLGLNVTEMFWYAPVHTSAFAFEPWRMLTSAVLHSPGSAMHILFNMVALWFMGRVLEPAIGHWRFAALLVLSAFGGSVAVLFLSETLTPTVGASGAVFGLFGALFILMRSSGGQTGGIVALVGINLVVSFLVPNISWPGHIGGLVTGALAALVIAKAPRANRTVWQGLGLAGLAVLLVVLTAVGMPLVEWPYAAG